MNGRSEDIIALARRIATEAGDGSDHVVIEVLARMVAVSASGVSSGFLRLPPGRPVSLEIRMPAALDDLRGAVEG